MYRLKIDEYKILLESYQMCLGIYFPDLRIECFETKFVINEFSLQYADIAGILIVDAHLIIKMGNCYCIHLPIRENAKCFVQTHPKNNKHSLFTLWGNNING